MHYAHHLKTLRSVPPRVERTELTIFSLTLALDAVKQYIIKRLAPEGTRERTEGVIVTFIWMAVSDVSHGLNPVELDADLTLYRQIWGSQLGPDAAHAVLLLLWKRIEDISADAKDDPSVWYKVALNSLLANAGDHNVGKIQRKMLVYYMKLPNLQAAKDGLAQMNDKVKQHPLSLYLGYSIAVQCHDERGGRILSSLRLPRVLIYSSRSYTCINRKTERQRQSSPPSMCWRNNEVWRSKAGSKASSKSPG